MPPLLHPATDPPTVEFKTWKWTSTEESLLQTHIASWRLLRELAVQFLQDRGVGNASMELIGGIVVQKLQVWFTNKASTRKQPQSEPWSGVRLPGAYALWQKEPEVLEEAKQLMTALTLSGVGGQSKALSQLWAETPDEIKSEWEAKALGIREDGGTDEDKRSFSKDNGLKVMDNATSYLHKNGSICSFMLGMWKDENGKIDVFYSDTTQHLNRSNHSVLSQAKWPDLESLPGFKENTLKTLFKLYELILNGAAQTRSWAPWAPPPLRPRRLSFKASMPALFLPGAEGAIKKIVNEWLRIHFGLASGTGKKWLGPIPWTWIKANLDLVFGTGWHTPELAQSLTTIDQMPVATLVEWAQLVILKEAPALANVPDDPDWAELGPNTRFIPSPGQFSVKAFWTGSRTAVVPVPVTEYVSFANDAAARPQEAPGGGVMGNKQRDKGKRKQAADSNAPHTIAPALAANPSTELTPETTPFVVASGSSSPAGPPLDPSETLGAFGAVTADPVAHFSPPHAGDHCGGANSGGVSAEETLAPGWTYDAATWSVGPSGFINGGSVDHAGLQHAPLASTSADVGMSLEHSLDFDAAAVEAAVTSISFSELLAEMESAPPNTKTAPWPPSPKPLQFCDLDPQKPPPSIVLAPGATKTRKEFLQALDSGREYRHLLKRLGDALCEDVEVTPDDAVPWAIWQNSNGFVGGALYRDSTGFDQALSWLTAQSKQAVRSGAQMQRFCLALGLLKRDLWRCTEFEELDNPPMEPTFAYDAYQLVNVGQPILLPEDSSLEDRLSLLEGVAKSYAPKRSTRDAPLQTRRIMPRTGGAPSTPQNPPAPVDPGPACAGAEAPSFTAPPGLPPPALRRTTRTAHPAAKTLTPSQGGENGFKDLPNDRPRRPPPSKGKKPVSSGNATGPPMASSPKKRAGGPAAPQPRAKRPKASSPGLSVGIEEAAGV
ncbi:uncharacterized protein BXZ73DRAFT_82722 [Epithele typhae]|uniref:uncharacterized protein n=1 Tax=Epithele typhae TaxID=378194 RepID=UPI00200824F1|nr:uncharacterized protein BXZ73DRAFT_82722 [Epithele typhae]KAH9911543.1 hypothetical protein BXZ73DRAFT_82722 [Epithele typhae]